MVEEGMYRHPLFWCYLLAPRRFERGLWSIARTMWSLVAVLVGIPLCLGLFLALFGTLVPVAGAATTAAAPAVTVTAVKKVVPTPAVRKVSRSNGHAPLLDTRCPGCSDEVVKVLR